MRRGVRLWRGARRADPPAATREAVVLAATREDKAVVTREAADLTAARRADGGSGGGQVRGGRIRWQPLARRQVQRQQLARRWLRQQQGRIWQCQLTWRQWGWRIDNEEDQWRRLGDEDLQWPGSTAATHLIVVLRSPILPPAMEDGHGDGGQFSIVFFQNRDPYFLSFFQSKKCFHWRLSLSSTIENVICASGCVSMPPVKHDFRWQPANR